MVEEVGSIFSDFNVGELQIASLDANGMVMDRTTLLDGFTRLIAIQIGPDGYLYTLEYGTSFFVTDGHTVFYGKDGNQLQTEPTYAARGIAAEADAGKFKLLLQLHQQGKTDFAIFCKDCAETGVEKWVVDTAAMTCTYYDTAHNNMLAEKILSV